MRIIKRVLGIVIDNIYVKGVSLMLRELPVSKIILVNTRRWINSVIEKAEFICFDTETFEGTCKLLCDSQNRFVYNPTFDDCLNFLFYKSSHNLYRAFYNIDFDISAILKLWNAIEQIDELIHGKIVNYKEYSMFYIRPKLFRLQKRNKTIFITDLMSMFQKSLNKASLEFLNDKKLDKIDANKLNTSLTYWIKNLDDIIKYCKYDAALTARLGNKIVDECVKCKLLLPKFFTSHASLSKQYFRFKSRIPSIKHIPLNILDIAYQCFFGGRFEALKRGFFEKLYEYDINSAYPAVICELPSLKYGKWIKVKEINPKETIGFYKAVFKIPIQYISPLSLRLKGKLIVNPSGTFATWITWYEADLLRDYITHLSYGYEYVEWRKEYRPFKKPMLQLYELKRKYKNTNETFYWLVKLVMNSLYGCFVERHRKADNSITSGILFNPIYGAIITAKTRWKLLKDIGKDNYHKCVAFHTDSVISTEPLKLSCNDKIGNWDLEAKDSGVILKSGIYQIGDIVKRRGFGLKSVNWIKELERFGTETKIKIDKIRAMKIAESLMRFHNIDKVNIFYEQTKRLDINTEYKRTWFDEFKNCNDLLSRNITSQTLNLSYINSKNLV